MNADADQAAPTVNLRLAAIRHLFDWLVTGQIVPHNPAASVRGPSRTAKQGKTPVLDASEARKLLDSIDVSTPIGLRDGALIVLMGFSFARFGAALAMQVEDVYVQQRRLWALSMPSKYGAMLGENLISTHPEVVVSTFS